jgi:hypothetical protein
MAFLCHADDVLRCEAFRGLAQLRALHMELMVGGRAAGVVLLVVVVLVVAGGSCVTCAVCTWWCTKHCMSCEA